MTTKNLTTAEYAKLLGKSVRTARRYAAKDGNATKVRGRWEIRLTTTQVRALRRRFVDLENEATRAMMAAPLGNDNSVMRAKQSYAREALCALGDGDLVLAIDHAKMWRGRFDAYGQGVYRRALAEIDQLVAA